MRKIAKMQLTSLALAVGLLAALPLYAQEQSGSSGPSAGGGMMSQGGMTGQGMMGMMNMMGQMSRMMDQCANMMQSSGRPGEPSQKPAVPDRGN